MPLVVLAFAVAADYANVSHFRSRVQLAADAASVAAAEAIARQPDSTNNSGDLAGQVAEFVFIDHAPRGAGTPTSRYEKPRHRRDGDCWLCRRSAEQFRIRFRLRRGQR